MKKLGLVIADGVGYRNFVMSDFLKVALKEYDEVIVYSGLIKELYNDFTQDNLTVRELDIFREHKFTWFLRKLKEVAHMRKHLSFFGINTSFNNGKTKKIKSVTSLLNLLAYQITNIFHSEKSILFYEKHQYNSLKQTKEFSNYIEFLSIDSPDYLFFTHQRPYNLSPLLAAAKALKIKTSTFIFSWDNLASKGRMLGTFDSYLVWSNLMKDEMKYFYPTSISNDIKVVGTPQFEPYVLEEYKSDNNYFNEEFNLDNTKKTIYYSCGDVSTSKLDPLYIEVIAKAIENKKIEQVNFIVRTSPAEDNTRFMEIMEKYSNITWNFPDWTLTRTNHTETWSQRVPSKKDIKDLRAILTYADVNINMCSTMSLDFMVFDKPVINSVFGNEQNGLYNDQKYLEYVHYKKVTDSGAVVVAKSENELIESINIALENPLLYSSNRKVILDLEIGATLKGTSERIVKALNELA
ncbi:hypothetical protein [Polaribacter sp. IC073]|uniref:hypothetical protein n=1 Tax=Polaribacter sp. IC073 TaxID=2508540 RepID=UPI0011BE1C7C|nr:hypothetical protein [Polaribacter sp. IC073]TXD49126.1 hypothetical protein ES045_03410 [Polaribacter sp. IC073]